MVIKTLTCLPGWRVSFTFFLDSASAGAFSVLLGDRVVVGESSSCSIKGMQDLRDEIPSDGH